MLDAVVVGSGPNGLAAAITLARAGKSVRVIEANETPGGGVRSEELTLPGFLSDVCSAIHPLGAASPFFRTLPLHDFGLEWIEPPAAAAHPMDDGTAVLLRRSVGATAAGLGRDAAMYSRFMGAMSADWLRVQETLLGPIRPPRHPLAAARFGLAAAWPAAALARLLFRGQPARALFAGLAGHAVVPLEFPATASFGLVLGSLAHTVGWPLPRGGSCRIADALVAYLQSLGGVVEMGRRVVSVDELPAARAVLLDLTPRQAAAVARDRLPEGYLRRLKRWRYGPGVFKMDWALDAPIPWRAAECLQAGTVHIGCTLEEIAASERAAWRGSVSAVPFVLLAQQSLFDPTRAPAGRHVAWAYCHVPNGFQGDASECIETQIERFAPGFRSRILARSVLAPADLERKNANLVGGDVGGGANDAAQLLARPVLSLNPYATPARGLFLCSSSTPPGGGVHGMCGYHAARSVLRCLAGPTK